MKHDWKKDDKQFYLPNSKPETIVVPKFNFYSIEGKGNPNDDFFAEYIGVLYSLSYALKMSPKQGFAPDSYEEYTVFPLEGVWDIDEEAKKKYHGILDKDALVFKLMMRQPDFATADFALGVIERTKNKKPHHLLDKVKFGVIEDGLCVQMLHVGSYDNEPASFRKMQEFAHEKMLTRTGHNHREIYLSDARKMPADKLKTVLRFMVK
jgi:hypothetical protein